MSRDIRQLCSETKHCQPDTGQRVFPELLKRFRYGQYPNAVPKAAFGDRAPANPLEG